VASAFVLPALEFLDALLQFPDPLLRPLVHPSRFFMPATVRSIGRFIVAPDGGTKALLADPVLGGKAGLPIRLLTVGRIAVGLLTKRLLTEGILAVELLPVEILAKGILTITLLAIGILAIMLLAVGLTIGDRRAITPVDTVTIGATAEPTAGAHHIAETQGLRVSQACQPKRRHRHHGSLPEEPVSHHRLSPWVGTKNEGRRTLSIVAAAPGFPGVGKHGGCIPGGTKGICAAGHTNKPGPDSLTVP